MQTLIDELKKFEGYREEVYPDFLGFPTCGWGHHLAIGSKVPTLCCDEFFKADVANAVNDYYRIPKIYTGHLNEKRKRVLTHLVFWIGLPRLIGFKKMWKAIEQSDFDLAADELISSKLGRQVPGRCIFLASQLRKG